MEKMREQSKRLVPVVLIVLIGLIGLSVFSHHWVFGSVAGAIALVWVAWSEYGRRKSDADDSETKWRSVISELDEAYLKAFHLHRHDWMNDIQLLIAYAKLQKTNQLLECADHMRMKAMRESALFKLGVPKLSLFLHSHYTEKQHVDLELEIEPNLRLDHAVDQPEATAELVMFVINTFRDVSASGVTNRLVFGMTTEQGKQLVIYFECSGQYDHLLLESRIVNWMSAREQAQQMKIDMRHEENGSDITLHIPLKQLAS